jgi:hypothetical protein
MSFGAPYGLAMQPEHSPTPAGTLSRLQQLQVVLPRSFSGLSLC